MKKTIEERSGFRQIQHVDPSNPDDLIVESQYAVDPYIEEAKRLSDQTPDKEIRHAAVIPQWVLEKAMREGWFNDPKKWKEWANDPDNKIFRTWPGQL